MARVVMFIHEEDGVYGASFPDFAGATTVARDLDTLYRKATDMLAFHVAGLIEDGDPVPAPRGLSELHDDPLFREGAGDGFVALVDVDLPGKAVRVNISLDESVLRQIDRAAEAAGETRSGFLVEAAKARLARVESRAR